MDVHKIAIIGAGLMGSGIAYVSAGNGFHVTLVDVNEQALEVGMDRIRNDVMTGVDKNKLSLSEAQALMGNLASTTNIANAVKEADLVI